MGSLLAAGVVAVAVLPFSLGCGTAGDATSRANTQAALDLESASDGGASGAVSAGNDGGVPPDGYDGGVIIPPHRQAPGAATPRVPNMSFPPTPPYTPTTQPLNALYPNYQMWAEWTQFYSSYWIGCMAYNNTVNEVLWQDCDQANIYEYVQQNFTRSNEQFYTIDGFGSGYGCIHYNSSGWLEESNTCSTFQGDSYNQYNETHDNQHSGYCVDFDGTGVMTESPCDGNNNQEFSEWWYWGLGSNPYPYVSGTISPYYPAGTGYVLDDQYNKRSNGNPVDIAPYNGTSAQFWDFVYNSTYQAYEIQLHGSNPVMCLDKPWGENANGTFLEIWQCNGGINQMWAYISPSQLINLQSNTCLDSANEDFNNPYMWIDSCWGGMNQQWWIP